MSLFDPNVAAEMAIRLLDNEGFTRGKPVVIVGGEIERTDTFAALAGFLNTDPVNLNLELAQALIESGQSHDLAGMIVDIMPGSKCLLLERVQLVMHPQLRVNAVDVICRVARRRPVCVSWPGRLEVGRLKYANQDHPEYLDEDSARVLLIDISTNEGLNP